VGSWIGQARRQKRMLSFGYGEWEESIGLGSSGRGQGIELPLLVLDNFFFESTEQGRLSGSLLTGRLCRLSPAH
jgi:hypothetical protein